MAALHSRRRGMVAEKTRRLAVVSGTLHWEQNFETATLGTVTVATSNALATGMDSEKEAADSSCQVWDNAAKGATWPTVPQGSRAVALTSLTSGTASSSTRHQLVNRNNEFATGTEVYTQWRMAIPSDFPDITSGFHNVMQYHASPLAGSPAVGWQLFTRSGVLKLERSAPGGGAMYSMTMPRGQWITITNRIVFAPSAAAGGLEQIWVDGVAQQFNGVVPGTFGQPGSYTTTGSAFSGDLYTGYWATEHNNNTGPSTFYLQNYRTRQAPASTTVLFDNCKIGSTYEIAQP